MRPHWRVFIGSHPVASYAFEDWGGRAAALKAAETHGDVDEGDEYPHYGKRYYTK